MTTLFKNISGENPDDVICVGTSVLHVAHSAHNFPCICTCNCIIFAVSIIFITLLSFLICLCNVHGIVLQTITDSLLNHKDGLCCLIKHVERENLEYNIIF